MDIIGELVLEPSPRSSVRTRIIGGVDKLGDSSASSWPICVNGGLDLLGNRLRVRSDKGEALKSRVGRAFRDATGVAAVIEESCVFKPWPVRLEKSLMTREYLLWSVSLRKAHRHWIVGGCSKIFWTWWGEGLRLDCPADEIYSYHVPRAWDVSNRIEDITIMVRNDLSR